MQSFGIREPRPGEQKALEALITDHFSEGKSYTVDLGLTDPDYHVRVAVEDGTILGVMAVAVYADVDDVVDEMYFFDTAEPLPEGERYGLLEMGYVRQGATGRGIGGSLLERVEEIGLDHDVDVFLADAWYHGGDDSPEMLFEAHGYETVYRDSLDRSAADCSKCVSACTCEKALTVRWVE